MPMPQLAMKLLQFVKPDLDQPRTHFTQAGLLSLGASEKARRQLEPGSPRLLSGFDAP